MNLTETISVPVATKAANSVSYAAAGSALAFGLTANEIGVIASIIIGVCTFAAGRIMEYHFRQKHYLLVKEHFARGGDRRKNEDQPESPCDVCPMKKSRAGYDG